jgi:glucoamylase
MGFLPPDHERVLGTIAAVEKHLRHGLFVDRYVTTGEVAGGPAGETIDGLPPGECAFLACSFWLVGAHARAGRLAEARTLFTGLLGLCNDVGLLSEEYDARTGRMAGNFPQAFSHLALVDAAHTLAGTGHGTVRGSMDGQRHVTGHTTGSTTGNTTAGAADAVGPQGRPAPREEG